MKTVQISDAVHAALTARHRTAEDVLRDALGLKEEGIDLGGGVILPNGSHFRCWYKDRPHGGVVREGAMEIEGRRYTSPSGAAKHVTHRPTNGWDFWEVRIPGREWVPMKSLRTNGNGHS